MNLIAGGDKVVIIKTRYGIEAATYLDEIQAVKEMISNGTLGVGKGGHGWGSSYHREAVEEVAAHIKALQNDFIRHDAEVEQSIADADLGDDQ